MKFIPLMIALKIVILFSLAAIALKHINAESQVPSFIAIPEPVVLENNGKDLFEELGVPVVEDTSSEKGWRCESWNGKKRGGYGEDQTLEVAYAIAYKSCVVGTKEICLIPVCTYKGDPVIRV